MASCPLARRQRQGWHREGSQAGAAESLVQVPIPLQALASLQSKGLVAGVPHPTPSLLSHKHVAVSCFPKCLCLCPLPPPPTLCTHPQEHVNQRKLGYGTCSALRPTLTFPLSPGCGQSPLWGQTLLCSSLPPSRLPTRVSGSHANFSITLSPPSPRTSPHFFQPSH